MERQADDSRDQAGAPVVTSAGSNATTGTTGSSGSGANSSHHQNHTENIKVAVRLRPFTEKERQRNCKRCVDIEQNTVALYGAKHQEESIKKFTFDYSYWSHDGFKRSSDGVNEPDFSHSNGPKYVGQERVFEDLGRFLLENALKGYNSALLAYGQTGSGKSYTVSGYGKNEGILPRFARELFAQLDARVEPPAGGGGAATSGSCLGLEAAFGPLQEEVERESEAGGGQAPGEKGARAAKRSQDQCSSSRYEVFFSMLEIYNEVVRDLLAKRNGYLQSSGSTGGGAPGAATAGASMVRRGLRVREHPKRGFFVENLTSIMCANKEEIERLIEEGQLNKSIAATSMNETSSRGHTIYEFHIKQFKQTQPAPPAGQTATSAGEQKNEKSSEPAPAAKVETLTTSVVQLVDLAGSERMAVHVSSAAAGGGGAQTSSSSQVVNLNSSSMQSANESRQASSRSSSPYPRDESSTRSSSKRQTSKRLPPNSASSSSAGLAGALPASSGSHKRSPREASSGAAGASTSGAANHGQYLSLTNSNQQRFKESVSINQSLSALGNCIQVLSQYSQQQSNADKSNSLISNQPPKIPYRDSVLTKLLNNCCLSGNSKVVLIATLSPADSNYDDTLSTLRFADRAKQIRTHATINRLSRGETVTALQRENERLKQILDGRVTRSDDSSQTSNFDDTENMQDNFNGPKVGATKPGVGVETSAEQAAGTRGRPLDGSMTATRMRGSSRAADKNAAAAAAAAAGKSGRTGAQAKTNASDSSMRDAQANKKEARGELSLRGKRNLSKSSTRLAPSPSPIGRDQMEQLVSSAAIKAGALETDSAGSQRQMRKSRSLSQALAKDSSRGGEFVDEVDVFDLATSGLLDDIELNDDLINNLDEENLLSPDSDDSFALPPPDERLTNEEKINILNRLLSNTNVTNKMAASQQRRTKEAAKKLARPKKAGARQHASTKSAGREEELSRVSAISSSLKQTNPYLSNLNPDEQLTGMISYIIKPGEMIVGKNQAKSDLLIYGPELRGKHAKLTRIDRRAPAESGQPEEEQPLVACDVFIEPILKAAEKKEGANLGGGRQQQQQKVALFVNGEPVLQKTKLSHCDRLLFGSNSYFVFIDNTSKTLAPDKTGGADSSATRMADTLADPDMVTYDMAHNEAQRKIMTDAKNEALIREINDFTHRPGTGKHRKQTANDAGGQDASGLITSQPPDDDDDDDESTSGGKKKRATTGIESDTQKSPEEDEDQRQLDKIKEEEEAGAVRRDESDPVDESYRERLMEDTYEFSMPVAEANAIAKEMGIRVSYGLKILTGEEQLLTRIPMDDDPTETVDEYEELKSLVGAVVGTSNNETPTEDNSNRESSSATSKDQVACVITTSSLIKPDTLDIAPQLYIHVHLEELNLDFYWSKEKFQERRVKMLELYGAWDVGGKSGLVEYLIEQSRYQGYYMIDPFIDELWSSFVLVGHAQVALQPVSHMSDLRETFDILDVNDDIVGSIQVEAIPCHVEQKQEQRQQQQQQQQQLDGDQTAPFKVLSERELATSFIEKPQLKLIGKKFVFLFKISACSNIPEKFSRILCQYSLNRYEQVVRTPLVSNSRTMDRLTDQTEPTDEAMKRYVNASSPPNHTNTSSNTNVPKPNSNISSTNQKVVFNHSHFIVIDQMDQDVLDFLQLGFLTIQVVGQYRLVAAPPATKSEPPAQASSSQSKQVASSASSSTNSSPASEPTLISTIINSINKYRFRMEQQSAAYANNQANAASMGSNGNYTGSIYANSLSGSAKSNQITSSGIMNSNSGASSVTSASATINLFDQQNDDDDEGTSSLNGISQENIIDMILTKRKLDRAENQLHYLKRTINIAEHYNKKHIPIKTVKKLLSSYGRELESGSLEEIAADMTAEGKSNSNKQSNCTVQ